MEHTRDHLDCRLCDVTMDVAQAVVGLMDIGAAEIFSEMRKRKAKEKQQADRKKEA